MKTKKPKGLTVTQDEENPISKEVLASAVVKIAQGVKRMNATPLNRRAVVVLLADQTRIAKSTVERVLNGLDNLEFTYLKKKVS